MDTTPRFTKTSRWRQGYEPSGVDAFCERLERDLAARAAGRVGELTATDVSGVRFGNAFGGYDIDEVDLFLLEAEERLADAQPTPASSAGSVPEAGRADLRERGELLQLMREPMGQRFPRRGRLARGYRVEDVDRFLDSVAANIAAIGPADVSDARFAEDRGGYAQDAVDDWLDRLEKHVTASS